MPWQDHYTPEAFRAEIKRLVFEDGLSMSRAAEVIGRGVTKNMIVRQCQTIMGKVRTTVTFPDSVWPSEPKSKDEPVDEPLQVPVHLTKVKPGQCRAPLWPDFLRSRERVSPAEHMMCGHLVKENSAYCDYHHEVFYPAELQRRPVKPRVSEVKDNSRHFG